MSVIHPDEFGQSAQRVDHALVNLRGCTGCEPGQYHGHQIVEPDLPLQSAPGFLSLGYVFDNGEQVARRARFLVAHRSHNGLDPYGSTVPADYSPFHRSSSGFSCQQSLGNQLGC